MKRSVIFGMLYSQTVIFAFLLSLVACLSTDDTVSREDYEQLVEQYEDCTREMNRLVEENQRLTTRIRELNHE